MKKTLDEMADLRDLIGDPQLADDVNKFNNGNKAAGTRIRKKMQEIKAKAQLIRGAVVNDLKTK